MASVYVYHLFLISWGNTPKQNSPLPWNISPGELVFSTHFLPLEGCQTTIWYLEVPFTRFTPYPRLKIDEINDFRLHRYTYWLLKSRNSQRGWKCWFLKVAQWLKWIASRMICSGIKQSILHKHEDVLLTYVEFFVRKLTVHHIHVAFIQSLHDCCGLGQRRHHWTMRFVKFNLYHQGELCAQRAKYNPFSTRDSSAVKGAINSRII